MRGEPSVHDCLIGKELFRQALEQQPALDLWRARTVAIFVVGPAINFSVSDRKTSFKHPHCHSQGKPAYYI
ncbi:hypothetical protein RchiOBHm_Chr2g0086621 [Rosa chinensis]|uniref:Uncharacterized protein n=1 Tax=Rosa chinensis TaxID=74649 RepID=A0A2P6RIG8_ROSCH|nr:hypothetical protein RchiOBHm_Chr2g0086621 [Rosa chinensis]